MDRSASAPVKKWVGPGPDVAFPYPEYHAEVREFFTVVGKFLTLWVPMASDYLETSSKLRNNPDAVEARRQDVDGQKLKGLIRRRQAETALYPT